MTKERSAPPSRRITKLVTRCTELCKSAERALPNLAPEREAFLSQNLEGALQQLELILRVVGESCGDHRDADRQSLLKRLFGRTADAEGEGDSSEVPCEELVTNFDVSSQGLQGNSWTVSLAELLGFLAFAGKTGVLWVDSPTENFLVGLSEGRLMHLSSDHTPEGLRLGEVLVGLGFLTRRQLERFLGTQGEYRAVSGESLLESGMICDQELNETLTYQVSRLFKRVIKTDSAIFRFQEGMNVQLAFQVDLDINQLLIESSRDFDEFASPAQSAASVVQEWNSWRAELGTVAAATEATSTETESTENTTTEIDIITDVERDLAEPEQALDFVDDVEVDAASDSDDDDSSETEPADSETGAEASEPTCSN